MENPSPGDGLLDEIYRLLASEQAETFRDLVERRKKELGITSDHELSKMTGIPNNTLARLLDGETQKVDLLSILKVCQLLGINVQKMIETFVASLKPEFVGELDTLTKGNFILRTFDRHALKRIGFTQSITDLSEINARITKFFRLSHIYQYARELPAVLFAKVKQYSKDEMRTLWIVAATSQFEEWNNPNPYDRDALFALIPKMRALTTRSEETGMLMAIRALYKAGVTVIVQRYLTNTAVKGASFIIKDKPCIVITDYQQKYPILWLTLLHELYHILFDYEQLKSWRFHLSGEKMELASDLFSEEMADKFAWDRLIPKSKYDYIRPYIDVPAQVQRFAAKEQVHPSIIYNFHCYNEKYNHNRDVYAKYQHLFGSSERAIKLIKLAPFNEESVYSGMDAVKEIYEYTPSTK